MPPWEIRHRRVRDPEPVLPRGPPPGHHVHAAVRCGRGSRRGSPRTTREHHLLDRPRDRPRAHGASASRCSRFYIVLFFAGGNDVIAAQFDLSVNSVTYVFRALLFVLPVVSRLRHLPAVQGAVGARPRSAGAARRARRGPRKAATSTTPKSCRRRRERSGSPGGRRGRSPGMRSRRASRIQQMSETASAAPPMSTSHAPNANPLAATAALSPTANGQIDWVGNTSTGPAPSASVASAIVLGPLRRAPREQPDRAAGEQRPCSALAASITEPGVLVRREPVDDADHHEERGDAEEHARLGLHHESAALAAAARSACASVGLGLVQVPHRALGADRRQRVEVVLGRRRRGGPLERLAVPRVVARRLAVAQRDEEVPEEREHADREDERTDGRDQVERAPAVGLAV